MFNGRKLVNYITSFSKIITLAWLAVWIETILFSQIAIIFNFGNVLAIQYINDNVIQIGLVICGFYFSTKCLENVAQGIEQKISEVKEVSTDEARLDEDEVWSGAEYVDGPEGGYWGEDKWDSEND